MVYLEPADFRLESLDEACIGIDLTDDEAPTSQLTAAIARFSQRVDDYTDDHFETEALSLDVDGSGSYRLELPKRCTAVSSVKLRDELGVLGAAQAVAAYRLRSSLYASGSKRLHHMDWIDLVPGSVGLAGSPGSASPYVWPLGPSIVQVVGSFGWTTTPADIKRATALMVWDHFKAQRGDLGRAEVITAAGETLRFVPADPGAGFYTGIPEADSIIGSYRRQLSVGVA